MTTKTPANDVPASTRTASRTIRIIDIVVSVMVSFFGLLLMLVLLASFVDSYFVQPFSTIVKILIVVSWFGGTAMFIVFATRQRLSFYWPVIGLVAIFVFFNLLAFIELRALA